MPPPLSPWLWRAALAAHLLLTALLLWRGFQNGGAWLAIPLLFPIAGLIRRRPYTAAWASMLLVFYVGGLLAEGYANHQHRTALFALAALAMLEFCCLVLFVRFGARERQAPQQP